MKWIKALIESERGIDYSKENATIVKYWCPMTLVINICILIISIHYLVIYKKATPIYNEIKSLTYIAITLIEMIASIFVGKSVIRENEKLFDIFLRIYILGGSVLSCLNFISTGVYTYFVGVLVTIMPLIFSLKKHMIDLAWLIISFFAVAEICLKDATSIVKMDITMSMLGLTWGLLIGIFIRNYNYLELAKAKMELERVNKADALTGIGNRLSYEIVREKVNAEDGHIAVLYADINNLKYVNDKYGHAAGDELIKTVAGVLQSTLNESFSLHRIGGDEFVGISRNRITFDVIEVSLSKLKNKKTKDGFDCDIAIGYASSNEFPEMKVPELEKIAEQRMYKHKTQYYLEKGIERRKAERRE